jgi:hypothetical protein
MKRNRGKIISTTLAVLSLGAGAAVFFLAVRAASHWFDGLNPTLQAGLVTAVATALVATLTVMLGRYNERRKEVEVHFREKKTEIYDSFLKEVFKVFHGQTDDNADLVSFLREWQRQMVLWGGAKSLTSFLRWNAHLKKGRPDAQSLFLMDEFFRAIRADLGLSNWGLEKGAFIRILLKHHGLFFEMARKNPNVTLSELAAREKELGLED